MTKQRRTAQRITRFMPAGVPRYVRCYDNGGKTFDRYTVVYTRARSAGMYVGMSADPFHPQGFGQHGQGDRGRPVDWPTYGHLGRKIAFSDLPEACRRLVVQDYRELWDL